MLIFHRKSGYSVAEETTGEQLTLWGSASAEHRKRLPAFKSSSVCACVCCVFYRICVVRVFKMQKLPCIDVKFFFFPMFIKQKI